MLVSHYIKSIMIYLKSSHTTWKESIGTTNKPSFSNSEFKSSEKATYFEKRRGR